VSEGDIKMSLSGEKTQIKVGLLFFSWFAHFQGGFEESMQSLV
jgi:hypothetical protein